VPRSRTLTKKRDRHPILRRSLIEFRGKQVKGRYDVVGKEITVISWNGIKKAQLVGTFSAEKVAHMLLRELASEAD
jgi:hypothetical protein